MVKNNKIKVLNIISGAKFGGAELFFERLACSFDKHKSIHQKIVIRSNKRRFNYLNAKNSEVEQISNFNYYNPFCFLKVEKIIKDFNPDIVLSWMNRASKILPNKKVNNEKKVGRIGGFYKIKNYVNCDFLITNTQDLKEYVISQGWDQKAVEYIPNFVNQNQNSILSKKDKNNNVILCMGRFHKNKAIDIIIKAMPFLPKFNLFIVGNGSLRIDYENLIKKFDLNSRVKIFEWSQDISEFLNSCSILVCPSRHEPFGNIVVDGWAHNIPVIVSDTGGPGKMVKHKLNGLKFEKDNVFDLVSKIKDLQSNKSLKRKIISNGFKTYKKNFSENVIVSKYLSFFRRIKRSCAE